MIVFFPQMYGLLPFDDTDHRKLMKQVQSRIVLPAKPEVSEEVKACLYKIFLKATDRVTMKKLQQDIWFRSQRLLRNVDLNKDADDKAIDKDNEQTTSNVGDVSMICHVASGAVSGNESEEEGGTT